MEEGTIKKNEFPSDLQENEEQSYVTDWEIRKVKYVRNEIEIYLGHHTSLFQLDDGFHITKFFDFEILSCEKHDKIWLFTGYLDASKSDQFNRINVKTKYSFSGNTKIIWKPNRWHTEDERKECPELPYITELNITFIKEIIKNNDENSK